MTKTQLLILLLIVALIFYYLNEDKTAQDNSNDEPWVKKPSTNPQPPKFKLGLNPPHSQLVEPPAKPPTSEPIKFLSDIPVPEKPLKVDLPSPQYIIEEDYSLNETYRQHFLTLLSQLTLTHLTQSAAEVLAEPNRLPSTYFQVLWSLKGLSNFSSQLAQPLREWINLTTSLKPTTTLTDYNWLTDDNLEFILSNHQPIRSALTKINQPTNHFHLRTDLANIYNSFQKAQTNQEWDLLEFAQHLTENKAPYTLFPLRVSGNHWGLFILENLTYQDPTPTYQVYYTSSGGMSLEAEKQQLQPFINQICGSDTPIQIIHPTDRQSKGYECGVYLVFYLQEILETGKLELNRQYTSNQCQQFRFEWKARIGEEKWCL